MKPAKATDLFLMDLIFIRLPVERLVLGPGFILTSPERMNSRDTHGLTTLKDCVTLQICPCFDQEGIVNPVETWVNARLKLYLLKTLVCITYKLFYVNLMSCLAI